MPKEWTPDEVRSWMLKELHDVYMHESPTALLSWNRRSQASDERPAWDDIYREAEWLGWKDYIKAQFSSDSITARITPAGREYVEEELLKPSAGSA